MKHVLAICATRSSLSTPLSLIKDRVHLVIVTKPDEIRNIKGIDPSIYDMIVFGAIDWRIPATCSGLAAHFRERGFRGPIIAVGRVTEWRTNMENAGCTEVFEREDQAAAHIRDILFPET